MYSYSAFQISVVVHCSIRRIVLDAPPPPSFPPSNSHSHSRHPLVNVNVNVSPSRGCCTIALCAHANVATFTVCEYEWLAYE